MIQPIAQGSVSALGYNRKPYFKVLATSTAGVGPYEMGIGPVPATKKALERAGLKIKDIDVIELNEAFASQCIIFLKEIKPDPARLNPNGGAIALGHPFGMTGVRLLTMLSRELNEVNGKYGLATLCVGGGMGMAVILERIPNQ